MNAEFIDDVCADSTPTTCTIPRRRGHNRRGHHDGDDEADDIDLAEDQGDEEGDEVREGIWVCRTEFNPKLQEDVTFSICIPSDRGIEGDGCGCCDAECPVACPSCGCILEDREGNVRVDDEGNPIEGSLVTFESDEFEDMCIPEHASIMLVQKSGGYVTCAECSE